MAAPRPDSLDREWRAFFEGFELALRSRFPKVHSARERLRSPSVPAMRRPTTMRSRQARFIRADLTPYRSIGPHRWRSSTRLIPRSRPMNPAHPGPARVRRSGPRQVFPHPNYLGGTEMSRPRADRALWKRPYCHTIGSNTFPYQEQPKRRWIQARIEAG